MISSSWHNVVTMVSYFFKRKLVPMFLSLPLSSFLVSYSPPFTIHSFLYILPSFSFFSYSRNLGLLLGRVIIHRFKWLNFYAFLSLKKKKDIPKREGLIKSYIFDASDAVVQTNYSVQKV